MLAVQDDTNLKKLQKLTRSLCHKDIDAELVEKIKIVVKQAQTKNGQTTKEEYEKCFRKLQELVNG